MLVRNEKVYSPKIDKGIKNDLSSINEKMLMEELRKLDNAYKAVKSNRLDEYISSLPDSIELTKKSYDAPSDMELSQKAENTYQGEYLEGKNKLIEDIENTREQLLSGKTKLSQAQQESFTNLELNYNKVKENISNQALKRGIGRSSIVFNKLSEVELSRAEKAGVIEKETRQKIENIESEIDKLDMTYQESLQAFDLKYAAKIEKELDNLIKERDKIAADIIEYNNKVEQKEKAFDIDKADKIDQYKDKLKQADIQDEDYFQKHGYYPNARQDYEDRYSLAHDFYMDLPKETSLRMFHSNSELEKFLGHKYYNQLKTVLAMRN